MLKFTFDFEKSVQASAILLRNHGKRMSYLRLLKLLYITDRELLATSGHTLTGDRAVAMDHGPVLSHVYDLIKQQADEAEAWGAVIRRSNYQVELVGDPGTGELTRREKDKLQEVCDRYASVDDWTLADHITHDFKEWAENYQKGTSKRIPWDDALKAQGKEAWIPQIEKDLAARRTLDALFGG
ncbi:MAG: Panacea domain-containing protein [Fimbriiglobus sp.]|jgi:uncharacterized phage-associated protein|nr:Panacea domain-containing protein [Fimbriiglobus sp.]